MPLNLAILSRVVNMELENYSVMWGTLTVTGLGTLAFIWWGIFEVSFFSSLAHDVLISGFDRDAFDCFV